MIPERNKLPGVCYAWTDDGVELPVVDVTHPAFAPTERPEDLPAVAASSMRALQRSVRVPRFVRSLMARRSMLLRGTMRGSSGFLDGMTTYLYKLGPENLGLGYASGLDRRMAATITPVAVRMRLRSQARLAAGALAAGLANHPGSPARLLGIAGGTAIDALNVCLLLAREHPSPLVGRVVVVLILDVDAAGPAFGQRALAALRGECAPLAGFDVTAHHVPYDWSDISSLRRVLESSGSDSVTGILSEGGLFEYGSDEEIQANLEVLREHTPEDSFIVGSTVRDCELLRMVRRTSSMTFQVRARGDLAALVERVGWTIEEAEEGNPLYEIVRLRKLGWKGSIP
jgi:hypothetical protein